MTRCSVMNAEGLKIAQRTAGRSRNDGMSTPSPFPKTPKQQNKPTLGCPRPVVYLPSPTPCFFFGVFFFLGPMPSKGCRGLSSSPSFPSSRPLSLGDLLFRGRMPAKNRDRSQSSVLPEFRPKMVKELTLLQIRCTDPPHTPSDPSASPQTTPSCEPHPDHYHQRVHHPQASSYSTSPPKHS